MGLKEKCAEDFHLFAVSLYNEAIGIKNTKWIIKIFGIVLPFFVFRYVTDKNNVGIFPNTRLIWVLVLIQFICCAIFIVDLLRKKAQHYEVRIYRDGAISFLFFAYGAIIIMYEDFFSGITGGNLFNTSNQADIEFYKIIILYIAFLIPILGVVYGIFFCYRKIESGEAHKNHDRTKKAKRDSEIGSKLLPKILPPISLFFLLLVRLNSIKDGFMISLTVVCCFFLGFGAVLFYLIAYIKKRFPEHYLQENLHKGEKRS